MKFSKLLVLGALWLTASGAKAEVPDGVWTVPEPQGLVFTEFVFDNDNPEHYYLYNPDYRMFFASGNDWSTRASIASFGYEMWFQASTEADAPEGSYEFWNHCLHPDRVFADPTNMFTDDGGATWVDHAAQPNYSWMITKVGDAYRIQNVSLIADIPSYEGKYIGWTPGADTRLYMITPEEGSVDWKLVTVGSYEDFTSTLDYEIYKESVTKYLNSTVLRAALVKAEGLGIVIDEPLAVYTNTESSAEELTAAADKLNAVITAKEQLKKLLADAADLKANVTAQQAIYDNGAATAAELQKAIDALSPIVEARKALKTTLDDAKTNGFSETAAYDAVFDNPDATAAELTKALTDLNAALVEWGKTNATVQNPANMTGKIKNPNFDNASNAGWSGTAPNMVGSGSHGPANVAEVWNATFDTYQDLTDLPAGIYALAAQTMWRGSWNDMQKKIEPAAKLYVKIGDQEKSVPFNYAYGPLNTESMAGQTEWGVGAGEQSYTDEESGITYYIPNDPSCFRLYAEKGLYDTKLLFYVPEGEARIGVKNPATKGDADNWSCFDTFTLTYYGQGGDACQLYLDETMKNYDAYEPEEGTLYTESYLTAYAEALNGEKKASSKEELDAVLASVEGSYADLQKNIELWSDWQEAANKVKAMAVNPEYESIVVEDEYLADYSDFTAPEILKELALTNEELEAEIKLLNEKMDEVIEKSKLDYYDGKDMTSYIKNPTFETSSEKNTGTSTGWTVDRIDGGNVTPGPIGGDGDTFIEKTGYYNACFESWHCHKWDVWQEIQGLPVGMYELQVQGYVRCEVGGYQKGDELEPGFPSPVYLYMNKAQSQFPSVYSQIPAEHGIEFQTVENWTIENINGSDFPNSMGGAAQCFNSDMYKTVAYGLIANEGDVFRIGVKMDANQDWWCIWDNFKLTYREPTVEVVLPILQEEMAKIDLSKPMGKDIYAKAQAVKEEAEAAAASSDAQRMFNALTAIYDLSEDINNSVALFAELAKASENLLNANLGSQAAQATKDEASALVNKIDAGIALGEFEDADATALIAQVNDLITKLGFPAGYEQATDEAPADFSGVIVNANYDEGVDGWSGTGAAWSGDGFDAEIFGKNFDYYQDIVGLPAGTYQLNVQGFYRYGGATEDYADYLENGTANSHAFIYAATILDGDTVVASKPLARLASEPSTEYYLASDFVTVKDATDEGEEGLAVANTMYTASLEFEAQKYQNAGPVINLPEGAKLRIGLKKDVDVANNWTIWDSWTLIYFGTASSKAADGDASGIIDLSNVPAVNVELFTIDGRKATAAQKGILIQKTTLSNGAVVVRKVRK